MSSLDCRRCQTSISSCTGTRSGAACWHLRQAGHSSSRLRQQGAALAVKS